MTLTKFTLCFTLMKFSRCCSEKMAGGEGEEGGGEEYSQLYGEQPQKT